MKLASVRRLLHCCGDISLPLSTSARVRKSPLSRHHAETQRRRGLGAVSPARRSYSGKQKQDLESENMHNSLTSDGQVFLRHVTYTAVAC